MVPLPRKNTFHRDNFYFPQRLKAEGGRERGEEKGGGRGRGKREIFNSVFFQIARRTGGLQSPISYLLVEFSWEGKSALRLKMYTFLPKCHSTSISFPDSDKRSLFLSKRRLSAPALIIKARSKKSRKGIASLPSKSEEFIIWFYFKMPDFQCSISLLFSLN